MIRKIPHLRWFIAFSLLFANLARASALFTNGDFEASTTALTVWTPGSAVINTATPIAGVVSATIPAGGTSVLSQDFGPATTDAYTNFTMTLRFRLATSPAADTDNGRIRICGEGGQNLLTIAFDNNAVRTFSSSWADDLTGLALLGNTSYWLRITGASWDAVGRNYEIAFSTDGISWATKSSNRFHATTSPAFGRLDFDGTTNGLTVDNIVITDPSASGPPVIIAHPGSSSIASGSTATLSVGATGQAPLYYQWYQGASGTIAQPVGTDSSTFITPALNITTSYWVRVTNALSSVDSNTATVTRPDKIVNISGVYPHLAMTNTELECGVGAVMPWAGKLWAITYGPHKPAGSSDKLYEINPDLSRTIRPESVGGTPANRFIHTPSNQLNIGPYFIDASRKVRVLRPSGSSTGVIPGRLTATAAHLTDPNRLYIFTMEDGLYDVNVNDLTYITRYPDVQSTGDNFLSGYHGKGAYTGQGRLVVGNNGEASQSFPSGVLATWDGAVNGSGANPDRMVAWNEIERIQTCEVTGPGGIYGSSNPATDPIWTTGFDAKSVVLHSMENNTLHTWRLPKASYTHDGSHGWHTEWPRIRQLDPSDSSSIYLMHMHGLFFDFPKTFSSTNFAGLKPISSYYKMPTDYCMFNGKLVMGKNDASQFANALALKDQSNLWIGDLATVKTQWGAPTGHGAVWRDQAVTAEEVSDPFLIGGFSQRTLHLRNLGAAATTIEIQTSAGTPAWTAVRSLTIPAGGYVHESIGDLTAPWIRLKSSAATSNLTAFFHFHTPYPHHTPASATSDEFAALADIRDTRSMSDGVIRVMNTATLPLEFASSRTSSSGTPSTHRYHRIGGSMELADVTDSTAESTLRNAAALTQEFGFDAASAWVIRSSVRYRLPKLDPLYEAPFAAGWARGIREAVTERELLNCHGTFYEVPRDISGGMRKMRALATHGKRITDFASWRGLFVLTGVLDDAPPSDKLIRNSDGSAALWLGEIDDLWRMGEPRGTGGPWKNTAVTANTASDAYLMYGYDRKELTLTAAAATTITVEVDFLANNTWSRYQTFSLAAGQTVTHLFPTGFHAHWVRVKSSTATTATAQFTYGPADNRDPFFDWARGNGIPTGSGRAAISNLDDDGDGLVNLMEFLTNGDPAAHDPNPIVFVNGEAHFLLRNLQDSDAIIANLEFSSTLQPGSWASRLDDVVPATDQTGISNGITRYQILAHPGEARLFFRLRAQ